MPTIYVLQCDQDKYYVGKSDDVGFRLEEHFNSNGSEWTKKYKPIKVEELYFDCDPFDEDKYTIMYMGKYGIPNVRGGSFCTMELSQEQQKFISNMISGATDKCYNCKSPDHFIAKCPNKNKGKENKGKENTKEKPSFFETLSKEIIHGMERIILPEKNICFKCGRSGHYAPDCYATTDINDYKLNSDKSSGKCYRCGRSGHYSPDCFAKIHVDGYKI